MLTKEQVNVIAERLLAQQREIDLARRNSQAKYIPIFYRCPALNRFEPWEQSQIVFEANHGAMRNWLIQLVLVGATIVGVSLSYHLLPTPKPPLPLLMFATVIPQQIIRMIVIRREVQRIARDQLHHQETSKQQIAG